MSMFRDPQDEDRICRILRAYVEEWGPENVIITLPTEWKTSCGNRLGRVRVEFSSRPCVSIRVEYELVSVLNYDLPLQL